MVDLTSEVMAGNSPIMAVKMKLMERTKTKIYLRMA